MDFRYFLKMESIVTWFGKEYRAVVPNLFGTRDQFCGRQFSHGQSRGMVSGRFKLITFIAHFSSPLMLLLISHEALVHGPEVGDPW